MNNDDLGKDTAREKAKATFLTSVDEKGGYVNLHSQINGVLDNFGEYVDNIMERNEKGTLSM